MEVVPSRTLFKIVQFVYGHDMLLDIITDVGWDCVLVNLSSNSGTLFLASIRHLLVSSC